MHIASLQSRVSLWVATSIIGCNEWKYQIVEVHGKYWIRGYHRVLFLVPFCFNVFMNYMFLFMERCNLYNYAGDNSIMYSSPDMETVILNLEHDYQNAIQWFTDNGMKANPNKFQFMVISLKPMEPQNIELHGSVSITSEPSVKILGVVIDDHLNFDEHISMCCTKAACQAVKCSCEDFQVSRF